MNCQVGILLGLSNSKPCECQLYVQYSRVQNSNFALPVANTITCDLDDIRGFQLSVGKKMRQIELPCLDEISELCIFQ